MTDCPEISENLHGRYPAGFRQVSSRILVILTGHGGFWQVTGGFQTIHHSLHSWVLGVDNLAKWQKNILQLKYLGGFMAMNLQILDK